MILPEEIHKKKILFCVLHWGLGHASRSVSVIKKLVDQQNELHIASDNGSLYLLKKEFHDLLSIELPAYNINYKYGSMIRNMLTQLPNIYNTYRAENHLIEALQSTHQFDYIISDNRYGCFHKDVHSIFIGHQLNILNSKGSIQKQATAINSYFISKFNDCWVPDNTGHQYSGLLSQNDAIVEKECIGIQSRFQEIKADLIYDAIAVLSGPEPTRTALEKRILQKMEHTQGNFLLIRGTRAALSTPSDHIEIIPFLTGRDLNQKIAESHVYIGRAGYSTIMDVMSLKKQAVLIPTPGQTEQEYLSHYLKDHKQIEFITEDQIDSLVLGNSAAIY